MNNSSLINKTKINTSTLTVQIISVVIILLSYLTTRMVGLIGGIICAGFLVSRASWNQKYSLLYFLFPFAFVFTFKTDQTSIFMILRIALIFSVIMYDFKRITPKIITALMFFCVYVLIVSFSNEIDFLRRLLNIVMWMIIIYFMQLFVNEDNSTPISRSLSNGTIISSFVGMNMELFPGMADAMKSSNVSVAGEIVGRFSGLMGDANMFTILVCMCLWTTYFEFNKNKISITEFVIRTALVVFFGFITFSKSCVLIMAAFFIYVIIARNNIKTMYKFLIILALVVGVSYYIIINPEWFDTMYIRFTGKNSSNAVNINTLTTGRIEIWKRYISYIGQTDSWVFGNGMYFPMPYGRAAHNIILQVLYYIGIIGGMLYINCLKTIYKTTLENYEITGMSNIGIFIFLSLFAIILFLDMMFLETFYYMISLCFIYMKKTKCTMKSDDFIN